MKAIILFFSILCFSCGNVKRVDTAEVKRRMNDYKVRKIVDADIMYTAEVWGQQLKADLLSKPEQLCTTNFKLEEARIEVLFPPFAVADPNPKIQKILSAYTFANTNKETVPDNMQKINDSTVLYSFQTNFQSAKCKASLVLLYLPNREIVRKVK
jgi:hypothetical protein